MKNIQMAIVGYTKRGRLYAPSNTVKPLLTGHPQIQTWSV